MRAKKQITEQEALAAMPPLYPLLRPGNLVRLRHELDTKIEQMALSPAQQHNLRNVYESLSVDPDHFNEKVEGIAQFLNGDTRVATIYCLMNDMESAADAMAVSKAEDINNRNHYRLPFVPMRREAQKKQDIDFIRAQLIEDMVTLGGIGKHEASAHLQKFERAMVEALNSLAGGVGR